VIFTQEKLWGYPCDAPGQRPQRGLVSLFACEARVTHRVALRQEQAAEEGGGGRKAVVDREETNSRCKHW
jgi:hypothetical protein